MSLRKPARDFEDLRSSWYKHSIRHRGCGGRVRETSAYFVEVKCEQCGRSWSWTKLVRWPADQISECFEVLVNVDALPSVRLDEVEEGNRRFTRAVDV